MHESWSSSAMSRGMSKSIMLKFVSKYIFNISTRKRMEFLLQDGEWEALVFSTWRHMLLPRKPMFLA